MSVAVGDRYVYMDMRITIVDVTEIAFDYAWIRDGSPTVVSRDQQALPVPGNWIKVSSTPVEPEQLPAMLCASCLTVEAEPGQVYCWTCLAMHATEWATLTEEEAVSRTIRMLAGAAGATAEAADREADERAERGETDGEDQGERD